jgi:hypothetical protein
MMPIPVAGLLGTVVGAGIRFVIKRPITSAAGAIIGYEILDGDGNILGDILPGDLSELETGLDNLGIQVRNFAENLGNEILEVIEGAGESLVKGIDRTFSYIKERFITGKEPDIVAGFTVTVLTIGAAIYLYNSVKNSNDAF